MEFIKVVENRRSIRKYKNKDVSKDLITELINSARLCQSAKNRQPWIFGVLKGKKKDYIADLMLNWCDSENIKEAENAIGYKSSVKNTANIIKEAPVLILVFRENNDKWITGDMLSIGAAIEHICLRATDLDLGSLWIRDTVYVQKEICEFVNHSELELVSTITIGYSNEFPNPRPRKDVKDMIVFYDE